MGLQRSSKKMEREVRPASKFKVQMYDFSCQGLSVGEKSETYLKIDFDNFKLFETDIEKNSLDPEWVFKAGFTYAINGIDRLCSRKVAVQCFDRKDGSRLVGEASMDLETIACGPTHFRLTLRGPSVGDDLGEPRGFLRFICVMKMISPNLSVVARDLQLTMQGSPAPARLEMRVTLAAEADSQEQIVKLPHSDEGVWTGPYSISFESSLVDLLKAPAQECLSVLAIDEMGVHQGEARLPFRSAFCPKDDSATTFKVPVSYSWPSDGAEDTEPIGAVGQLEGSLSFQNVPKIAQMAGGCNVDGQIEGGCWLCEGLPYPQALAQPPPVWQEPFHLTGTEAYGEHSLNGNHERPNEETENTDWDDIDDKAFLEALDKIELPPPWEKRRDRSGDHSRCYFADSRSRRTTWKDPRLLPDNWEQRVDRETGKVYFQYHKTRETTYVDPRGCPTGWEMRLSKAGDVYFAYLPAMQTTYIDPRGLPEGVDAALDDQGRMYFKHHHTRSTAWEDPRDNQQEVTLTKWRQAQSARWWKEHVRKELDELLKQRNESDERDEEESDTKS